MPEITKFGRWKGNVDCKLPEEMVDEIIRISEEELDLVHKSLLDNCKRFDLEVHYGWNAKEATYQAYVQGVEEKTAWYGLRLNATGKTPEIALSALYVKMDMRQPSSWEAVGKAKKLKGGIS